MGGVTQLAFFGVRLLTEQGLAACARQAAVMVAASTAVNFASGQAVSLAQQYGVDPAYIRIGADAIQVVMLWKAAKLERQGCFIAGTQVLVGYDGQGQPLTWNIEDLRVGDGVLARDQNDENDDVQLKGITGISSHTVYQLRKVVVSDGNGNIESLESTVEHPYYVRGKGWTNADELEAGDLLLGDDGTARVVETSFAEGKPDGVTVYNLTVEGDHTYFVEDGAGTQEFVWVHNGACDGFDNKVNHIFGPNTDRHNLNGFVAEIGSETKALQALEAATKAMAKTKNLPDGLFTELVAVGNYIITVSGNVIGGVPKIGSAYIP